MAEVDAVEAEIAVVGPVVGVVTVVMALDAKVVFLVEGNWVASKHGAVLPHISVVPAVDGRAVVVAEEVHSWDIAVEVLAVARPADHASGVPAYAAGCRDASEVEVHYSGCRWLDLAYMRSR